MNLRPKTRASWFRIKAFLRHPFRVRGLANHKRGRL